MQAPVLSENVQKKQNDTMLLQYTLSQIPIISHNVCAHYHTALLKPNLTHKDLHSTAYPFMPQVKDLCHSFCTQSLK